MEGVDGYCWVELLQVTACPHGDEQFIGHIPTSCVQLGICSGEEVGGH